MSHQPPTCEYLNLSGHPPRVRPGRAIERLPMFYLPSSTSQVNHERLPPPHDMADMELAFREEQLSDDEAREVSVPPMLATLLVTMVCLPGVIVLTQFVKLQNALMIAGAFAVGWLALYCINIARRRRVRFSGSGLIVRLLGPLVAVIAVYAIGALVTAGPVWRWVASLLLAQAVLTFLWRWGRDPIRFYLDWLMTDRCLTPKERHEAAWPGFRLRILVPTVAVMGVVLGMPPWISSRSDFVPPLSWPYTVTIVSLLVASVGYILLRLMVARTRPSDFIRFSYQVLGLYMFYGRESSQAPGVWMPKEGFKERRFKLQACVAVLISFLMVGLNFFAPEEFVRWQAECIELAVAEEKFDSFGYSEEVAADELRGYRVQRRATLQDDPFYWIKFTWGRVHQGELMWAWALLVPFMAPWLVVTPVMVLIYTGPLLYCMKQRKTVDERRRDDPRSEWQWLVDRIDESDQEAVDPMGKTVREAEHLFLGVEPKAHFPVLLDREILSEHAYIVGETGSGKTAVAIMPLLMQLIRGYHENKNRQGANSPQGQAASGTAATGAQQDGGSAPVPTPSHDQAPSPAQSSVAQPTADDPSNDEMTPVVVSSVASNRSLPPPLVILDLKGDLALFHTIRQETDERRRQLGVTDPHDPRFAFRFFTPEKDRATYAFNPFSNFMSQGRSDVQLAQLMLESLGLHHGEGYGRSYYSRRARWVLQEALTKGVANTKKGSPQSFNDLDRLIQAVTDQTSRHEAFELVATVKSLSGYEALKPAPPEQSIHIPDVLEHRQCAYFWLPAAIESVSVKEIGKLAFFCLLTAALDRQRSGQELRQSYLFIDEFQRIVSANVKIVLEQARSFGIGAILANQSLADLNTPDIDMRPVVRSNTRFKQYLGLNDVNDIAELSERSGEEMAIIRSHTATYTSGKAGGISRSFGEAESLKRRLTTNDIIAISDHPLESVIQVSRGSGYSQFGGLPIPVRSTYALHWSDYKARQNMPWPDGPVRDTQTVQEHDAERDSAAAAGFSEELEDFGKKTGAIQ